MIVQDFIAVIEEFAPLAFQADYDNAGLIVGNRNDEVSKVLISFDVTAEVLQEAIGCGANMIVSHHPLVFRAMKKFNNQTDVEKCLKLAMKHDIAIYACHTNMDSVQRGVNGQICEKIGLVNCRILVPRKEDLAVGDGMIGELPQAENTLDFLKRIKKTFGCGVVRHTEIILEKIQKVAVCGGSGSFLIQDAIAAGADIFITADVKYHDFFEAEKKLVLADIGHYESEHYIKELIYDLLMKNFYNFAFQISKVNTNPINYI